MKNRKGGVIAAGSEFTAEAAAEILKAGGNAYDAAIAAAWMTFVAEPTATSAGGGGFINIYTEQGKSFLLDCFAQTPIQKHSLESLDFFPVDIDYGGAIQTFHAGRGSIALPGMILGLFDLHKKFGSIPMIELVQPTLKVAKEGFLVDAFLEWCFKLVGPAACSLESGKSLFAPNGELPKKGDLWKMTDFANTLEYLAKNGSDEFYRGEIAEKVGKDFAENGGHLSRKDFESFEVVYRNPLRMSYRESEVITNPPPSAGGSMVAFTLKLMEQKKIGKMGFGTAEHLSILASAMRITSAARNENFDNHIYDADLVEKFFNQTYMQTLQDELSESINKHGSTTHFSVADRKGNFIAMTSSLGEGSGYVPAGTGIMMNNMLGEEDLNPHGFHRWPENQRITSMMAPTIVLKNGRPTIATGSGGANRIRSVIAQIVSNFIDFKMEPNEVLEKPRIHWENDTLDIEPGFTEEAKKHINLPGKLRKVYWENKAFYFGGAHTVYADRKGNLHAIGDKRRTGAVREVK